jgi:acetate---CoA ligase (ADP-forming)
VHRVLSFGEGNPPRSIAIVGVSRNDDSNVPDYTGLKLLRILRGAGFQGHIYPVNPNATSIDDITVYPNGPMIDIMAELQKSISSQDKKRVKPVVVALSDEGGIRETEKYVRQLREMGIVAYNSLQ